MNKYRLKKDLPFAKAGADVQIISVYGDYVKPFYTLSIKGDLIPEQYRTEMPKERFAEWVEEVKPREWYVVIGKQNKFPYICGVFAEQFKAEEWADNGEIIKVREVIE